MFKIKRYNYLFFAMVLCVTVRGFAQNHLNSPYSRFGLGDLMPRTSTAVTAMGGTGYTFQSATAVNFTNPASYMGFDTLSFLLDASFSWKNQTLLASTTQRGSTFNFDYLSAGFSIAKWWKTAVGVQPYSLMNYTIREEKTIDSAKQILSYLGEGGINEVFWGNSFKLFKNFSFGVNASVLFGISAKTRSIEWNDSYHFNTNIESANKIRGAVVTLGAQYFIPIKEKGDLGLGFVYTPPIPVRAIETNTISTSLNTGTAHGTLPIDTLYPLSPVKRSLAMPTQIGGGISWGKKDKYFVGVDVTWKNWSSYKVDNVKDTMLSDVLKLSIGSSYTPNAMSNKFFPRMTFSLGVKVEQTYLFLKNEHLKQFGINFGLLFPLKRSKTALGLVFEYGQMGTTKNNLIKENYYIIGINLRIHERWYQRKKLD